MRIICFLVMLLWCISVVGDHDEPGSFREYELRQERVDIEINITELLYQLAYVPVSVRPRVYGEIEQLQQRWNQVLLELIEIDRVEHPQPPVK